MVIDRSSFDEDDGSVNDESTIGSLQTVQRRKNGRVRRKLRWKPAAFRARNNRNKASADAASVGERSNRTSRSFHTFNSSETPVKSNSSKTPHNLSSPRPNYPDTFEGMVTIDNEGEFVHARMLPRTVEEKRTLSPPATVSPLSTKGIGRMPSFDFHPIAEDSSFLNPYKESKPHIFDPFGQYMGLPGNTIRRRPPKWRKKGARTIQAKE